MLHFKASLILSYVNLLNVFCYKAHLLSVFDNTKTVTFDDKIYEKILSITSQEGETVQLKAPVMATVLFSVFLLVVSSSTCAIVVMVPLLKHAFCQWLN